MKLAPISVNLSDFPAEFHSLISGVRLYDSSCSEEARTFYIEKDGGYFLKRGGKGALKREATTTDYFYKRGLSAKVCAYVSSEREKYDWLLTEKIMGEDCISVKYLEQPEKLCVLLAELLAKLHSEKLAEKLEDFNGLIVPNHTEIYLANMERNRLNDWFNAEFGFNSAKEAQAVIEENKNLLKSDVLLHGDYCLPNIILDDWKFSGFIDLDRAGIGDRRVDVFWGMWTLKFNLKTDDYGGKFLDAYNYYSGEKIVRDALRIIAAVESFL